MEKQLSQETKNKIGEANKGSRLSGRKSVDEKPEIQEEYIKIYFLRHYQYYSWLELMEEFGCSRKKIERALKWVEKRFLELPPKSLLKGAIFAIERRLKAHTAIWEKEVNLLIAKVLKEVINSSPNMTAFLTRTHDKDMTLTERIAFAERHRGDVFLSIHCNATRGYEATRAQGIELFYWNEKGSDNAAVRYLEELENEGQLNINGSKENATLFKNLLKDKLEVEKNKSIEVCSNISTALKHIAYFHQ